MIARALLLAAAASAPAMAHAADLRVLTTGAYKAVIVALAPAIEQEMGHKLLIENDTAGVVARRVRASEAFDLVVLPPSNAQSLGALIGPATPLARVGIGIAVKAGAPAPDVSTPEAVRAAVLAARAPAWIDPAAGGSSGIYMGKLFETWGIATQLAPKAVLVQGGLVADKIASGQADIGFQQLSELRVVPGVAVVGLLPAAIQNYTVYAGALPANSPHPAAAAAVLTWLAGPKSGAVLTEKGLERP
jgi:molybdate transport system substrate-binding protein